MAAADIHAPVDLGYWLAEDDVRLVPPRCDYLFHRNELFHADTEVLPHQHHFWQLEVVKTGRLRFVVDDEPHLLGKGMGILVPQQCTHAISYLDEPCETLTVKFHVGTLGLRSMGGTCLSGLERGSILQALVANLRDDGDAESLGPVAIATANALLGALVAAARSDDNETLRQTGSTLVAQVKEAVLKNGGRPLAVKEVAEQLDLSSSHLTARFRRETGIGLKQYIDQQRGIFAARQLAFTDTSIGKVAEALAFADSFAFSRFFRRVVGVPPSDFRKLAWEQLQEG